MIYHNDNKGKNIGSIMIKVAVPTFLYIYMAPCECTIKYCKFYQQILRLETSLHSFLHSVCYKIFNEYDNSLIFGFKFALVANISAREAS